MSNCPRPQARPATALVSASHEDGIVNETTPARQTRPRPTAVLAVTVGFVLLTAACSGSPSSTGSGGSPHAGGSGVSALGYAHCMRSHGVPDFPDPDSTGGFELQQLGVSKSKLLAADGSCRNLLPAGSASLTVQDERDYVRASACMRSHGIINFPDPTFYAHGGVNFLIPSSVDTSSTQFTRAQQTCAKLIPAGLPYSSGSGG